MEPIAAEEYSRRLGELCLRSGVVGLPRHERDRDILLHSATRALEPGATYTQREIDRILRAWLTMVGRRIETDHVALRRALVDYGFLERDGYGREYSLPAAPAGAFGPGVDALDPAALIAAEAAAIDRRRAKYAR